MSPITLTLRKAPAQSVDCSPIVPDAIAGKTTEEVESIALACGNRMLRVKELFDVAGNDTTRIVIRAGSALLERIAAGMKSGSICVEGDCGAYAGLGLLGGQLVVTGNAGAFAASGMRGGSMEIRGNAADFLGAALAGDKQGMRGGTVVVRGNAGDRCGDRMRRGLILIKGDSGDYCGSRMLAGTIVVQGRVGRFPGFALRRGTLVLASIPPLGATFQNSGEHNLLFLDLLERHLLRAGEPIAHFVPVTGRVQRFCGDLAADGAGEILVRPQKKA